MPSALRLLEHLGESGSTIVELSSKTGLSFSTLRRYLRELENSGLVEKRGELFAPTEKGLLLGKTLRNLRSGRAAQPYIVTDPSTGQPVPLSFRDYRQLLALIEGGLADSRILEEHMKKYMAKWVREALGDEYLAYMLESGQIRTLEDLKRYIEMILDVLR